MQQESRHHPPEPGQLRWRLTGGTAKEEQPVGQSFCQALLSHAVTDARVGAGSWPTFLEVLLQLMGHDEAGALVQFFCPRGCFGVYQNVRGPGLQHTSGVNCLRYTTALPRLFTHACGKLLK